MESQNEKRAVIYCRVSTKEQVEEGNSLSTQEKICRDYALKNGYEIALVFIEQGESAKTADRTELQKLLAFCAVKKNNIAAVIAYKIDRISRNTDDYSQIRILLKRYGVEIKSTSEYFENTPAGRFMENIIANVAQFDNDVRAERCAGGMRDAVREGRYVWMAPAGYSNVKIDGKANIAPNESAPMIREAFEEVAKGMFRVEKIYQDMLVKGLRGRNGKPFSRSHFYNILKNELYAGWIKKFGERHKGTFEPIVSESLFMHVQRVLERRKKLMRLYRYENPDFPLRRFIKDLNGNKLTGGWSAGKTKKYPYYRFIKAKMDFRKEFLESTYAEFVQQFSLKPAYFSDFKEKLQEKLIQKTFFKEKEATKLQDHIATLKAKQKTLIDKNLKGVISDTLLQEHLAELEHSLFETESLLRKTSVTQPPYGKLLQKVAEFLKNPGNLWQKTSFAQKVRLQEFKFPKGLVFDGKNFRTPEICRILNVKWEIFNDKSGLVDYDPKEIEHPLKTNFSSPIETKLYWERVGKELIVLNDILNEAVLQEKEGKNSSSTKYDID